MKESIIALIDCDSFFVSCEQAVDKSLQGKPVCVLSNNDGCIVARSREAKKLGIKMGMPYFMAQRQYPEAIYLSGNHTLYKDFSKKVIAILKDFSPTIEVYSIDEAFLELSGLKKLYKINYLEMAKQIKNKIFQELEINVSIGVSKSKVLAKLACEKAKKNNSGIFVIGKAKLPKILKATRIGEVWGIGKNTELLLNKYGILTCRELIEKSDEWIKLKLGKKGLELKYELLGEYIDKIKIENKLPKSIQNTRSFPKFTNNIDYIKNELNIHIHASCKKLRKYKGRCKTVSIMLRTKDFKIFWDKKNLDNKSNFEIEISRVALKLLEKMYNPDLIYRSCGITLENLEFNTETQLTLFSNVKKKNFEKLADAIDKLETKFGKNIIKTGFVEK